MRFVTALRASLPIVLSLYVLVSCEGADPFLSTGGSYEVSARTAGKAIAAGTCLSSSSDITPFFVSDISGDPDAAGLSVSLESPKGVSLSRPVEYRTDSRTSTALSPLSRVTLLGLSGDLPSFRLPASIPPGFYVLCYQVLGSASILAEQRIPVYYRSDAALALNDLHTWPPGESASEEEPLLPVGVPLLFDLDITADKRLDPLIIWTLSGREIARGRLSEGADRIFWTAPSADGIYTLKAEVLPVVPASTDPCVPLGESLSLAIATSSAAPVPGFRFTTESCTHWFRFLGDLSDSVPSGTSFRSTSDARPLWAPVAANYGLEISQVSSWFLPVPLLPLVSGEAGDRTLSILCSAESPGSLFRADYPIGDGSSLRIELGIRSEGFELRLSCADLSVTRLIKVPLTFGSEPWLIDTRIFLRSRTLTAEISCGSESGAPVSILLPAEPVGLGSSTLGGKGSFSVDYILPTQPLAVIDEIAVH